MGLRPAGAAAIFTVALPTAAIPLS